MQNIINLKQKIKVTKPYHNNTKNNSKDDNDSCSND